MNNHKIAKKKYKIFFLPPFLNVYGKIINGKLRIFAKGLLKNFFLNSFSQLYKYMDDQKPAYVGEQLVFSLYIPKIPSNAFNRIIKNHVIKGFFKLTGGPDAATLAVTQNCQAHCNHCSAYRRSNRPKKELTTSEWKNIIDKLISAGCYNITFTGGEPLLRKDIFELIQSVDKEKAIAQMFSNGYALDKKTAIKLKKSGLDCIHISIDSIDPSAHDKIRGVEGLFQKAVKGIKNCLDAGILVGISMIATPEAIKRGEIKRFIELGKKLNVHCVTFADPIPTGKWLNKNPILSEKYHDFMQNLHIETNRRGIFPRIETMSYVNGPRGAGCFGGINQLHITPHGYVTPCDLTPLSFGNVKKESIKEIWRKMRKHSEYKKNARSCRMQNPEFRHKYIERIPDATELPYPIEQIDEKIKKSGVTLPLLKKFYEYIHHYD